MIPDVQSFDVISAWMDNAHRRMSRKYNNPLVLGAKPCYT
jgi:hypothetical protein